MSWLGNHQDSFPKIWIAASFILIREQDRLAEERKDTLLNMAMDICSIAVSIMIVIIGHILGNCHCEAHVN